MKGTATTPAATAVMTWRRPKSRGARGALEVQVKLTRSSCSQASRHRRQSWHSEVRWRAGFPGAKAAILQISVQSPQSGQRAAGRRRSREKRAIKPYNAPRGQKARHQKRRSTRSAATTRAKSTRVKTGSR